MRPQSTPPTACCFAASRSSFGSAWGCRSRSTRSSGSMSPDASRLSAPVSRHSRPATTCSGPADSAASPVCMRFRTDRGGETTECLIRASRGDPHGGIYGFAGDWQKGPSAPWREGADRRRLRRSRHVRSAAGEGVRRRGHGSLQHPERRDRAIDRRGSRHRLQPRGLYAQRPALRSDHRCQRVSADLRLRACPRVEWHLRHERRGGRQILQAVFQGLWLSKTGNKTLGNLMATAKKTDLLVVKELLETARSSPSSSGRARSAKSLMRSAGSTTIMREERP